MYIVKANEQSTLFITSWSYFVMIILAIIKFIKILVFIKIKESNTVSLIGFNGKQK